MAEPPALLASPSGVVGSDAENGTRAGRRGVADVHKAAAVRRPRAIGEGGAGRNVRATHEMDGRTVVGGQWLLAAPGWLAFAPLRVMVVMATAAVVTAKPIANPRRLRGMGIQALL